MSAAAPVLVVGASWAEPGSALVRALGAKLGRPVDAAGVRGATLSRWLNSVTRNDARLLQRRDLIVVVEAGGNGAAGAPEIRSANALLEQGGASVVWLMPPHGWPDGEIRARRERTRAALRVAGVATLDTGVSAAGKVSADGVHPTRALYVQLGEAAAKRLRRGRRRAVAVAVAAAAAGLTVAVGKAVFR